ncbi:hypothetical protein Agub_g9322, partial [Astrephomene gubernaculifera]
PLSSSSLYGSPSRRTSSTEGGSSLPMLAPSGGPPGPSAAHAATTAVFPATAAAAASLGPSSSGTACSPSALIPPGATAQAATAPTDGGSHPLQQQQRRARFTTDLQTIVSGTHPHIYDSEVGPPLDPPPHPLPPHPPSHAHCQQHQQQHAAPEQPVQSHSQRVKQHEGTPIPAATPNRHHPHDCASAQHSPSAGKLPLLLPPPPLLFLGGNHPSWVAHVEHREDRWCPSSPAGIPPRHPLLPAHPGYQGYHYHNALYEAEADSRQPTTGPASQGIRSPATGAAFIPTTGVASPIPCPMRSVTHTNSGSGICIGSLPSGAGCVLAGSSYGSSATALIMKLAGTTTAGSPVDSPYGSTACSRTASPRVLVSGGSGCCTPAGPPRRSLLRSVSAAAAVERGSGRLVYGSTAVAAEGGRLAQDAAGVGPVLLSRHSSARARLNAAGDGCGSPVSARGDGERVMKGFGVRSTVAQLLLYDRAGGDVVGSGSNGSFGDILAAPETRMHCSPVNSPKHSLPVRQHPSATSSSAVGAAGLSGLYGGDPNTSWTYSSATAATHALTQSGQPSLLQHPEQSGAFVGLAAVRPSDAFSGLEAVRPSDDKVYGHSSLHAHACTAVLPASSQAAESPNVATPSTAAGVQRTSASGCPGGSAGCSPGVKEGAAAAVTAAAAAATAFVCTAAVAEAGDAAAAAAWGAVAAIALGSQDNDPGVASSAVSRHSASPCNSKQLLRLQQQQQQQKEPRKGQQQQQRCQQDAKEGAEDEGRQQLRLEPAESVDLDLNPNEIQVFRDGLLGQGAFGAVYRGVYRRDTVAVKLLNGTVVDGRALQRDMASFHAEMSILSRLRHRNIVRLYGGCMRPPHIFLVMQLMRQSLDSLIHHSPRRLTLLRALEVARDVAAGLSYLHNLHPTVVHRDLKPANILIDDAGIAKISDFGLARYKFQTYLSTRTPDQGSVAYMAPECFNTDIGGLGPKTDVYSFGVLLWELLSGEYPWRGESNVRIIYMVAIDNQHLPLPPDDGSPFDAAALVAAATGRASSSSVDASGGGGRCPSELLVVPPPLRELLRRCFSRQPGERPDMREVVRVME